MSSKYKKKVCFDFSTVIDGCYYNRNINNRRRCKFINI